MTDSRSRRAAAVRALAALMLLPSLLGWTVSRAESGGFTNYSIEDGLAVLEDRDGTLWIGTSGGMAAYDGEALRPVPEARVIVSSGYSNDPVMADCRRYGFVDALPKPFTAADLGRVLERALSRQSRTTEDA